ncbi:MAG: hypothetical protein LBJ37_09560 [Paucimonas sp.]|nr:hypothetical protein [Paucimonas sp.]
MEFIGQFIQSIFPASDSDNFASLLDEHSGTSQPDARRHSGDDDRFISFQLLLLFIALSGGVSCSYRSVRA